METTCYIQIEPTFWHYGTSDRLRSIAVKRVTQKRPDSPIPGSLVVKLSLDIGDAAFGPLAPQATVVIPAEHTEAVTVRTEPLEVPA